MTLPKELTTVTPFSKYLAMFLFIVLPFLGFGLGVQYGKSMAISATSVVMTKQTTTVLSSPTLTPSTHTFVSADLGISFQYLVAQGSDLQVKEIGDKVYVYPRGSDPLTGKYVEVFSKSANMTLIQAIQEKFLSNIASRNCTVKVGSNLSPSNPKYQYARISIMNTTSKIYPCPPVYTEQWSNGIDFFVMDPNHPTKYAFFSLGQDSILATYPTPGVTPMTWDDTLTFN